MNKTVKNDTPRSVELDAEDAKAVSGGATPKADPLVQTKGDEEPTKPGPLKGYGLGG